MSLSLPFPAGVIEYVITGYPVVQLEAKGVWFGLGYIELAIIIIATTTINIITKYLNHGVPHL